MNARRTVWRVQTTSKPPRWLGMCASEEAANKWAAAEESALGVSCEIVEVDVPTSVWGDGK